MFNRYLTYYKTSVQILTFFLLLLLAILLVSAIDSVLIPWLTGGISSTDFADLDLQENAEFIQVRRIEQFVVHLIFFLAPALTFAYLAFPRPKQYLKLNTTISWKHILLGGAIMLLSLPLISLLEYLNKMIPITEAMQAIEASAKATTDAILDTSDPKLILFNIFLFVVLPAISEELFFRGAFQNILLSSPTFKKNPFTAIAIAAFFFSLMHLQMAGFVPRFFAGFILGCAYYMSNNILVPMIMHALNNGMVLAAFYLSRSNYEDAIGTLDFMDFVEIIPLTLLGGFLFYKFYMNKSEYIIDQVEIDPDETHFLANK